MVDLFTTREYAIGVLFGLFIIYALFNKECRKSLVDVYEASRNKYLIIPLLIISLYLLLIIFIAKKYIFITPIFIKEVIMWYLFVGVPNSFNAVITDEEHYFGLLLLNNFRFSSVAAFICSSYTFSLIGEIFLQFIVFILIFLSNIAGRNRESKKVEFFINFILGSFYIWLFIKSLYTIIVKIEVTGYEYYLTEVSIPIVLSLLFLPMAYLFALYAKYQLFSFRLGNIVSEYEKKKYKYLFKTFYICGISYKRIKRFNKEFISYLCEFENVNKADDIINNLNKKSAARFYKGY